MCEKSFVEEGKCDVMWRAFDFKKKSGLVGYDLQLQLSRVLCLASLAIHWCCRVDGRVYVL
jgi:hypothetical protein